MISNNLYLAENLRGQATNQPSTFSHAQRQICKLAPTSSLTLSLSLFLSLFLSHTPKLQTSLYPLSFSFPSLSLSNLHTITQSLSHTLNIFLHLSLSPSFSLSLTPTHPSSHSMPLLLSLSLPLSLKLSLTLLLSNLRRLNHLCNKELLYSLSALCNCLSFSLTLSHAACLYNFNLLLQN